MGGASCGIAARFKVALRCQNCAKRSIQVLEVPEEEEAPRDVEALLESAFLARIRFTCAICEYPIATIVAMSILKDR